MVQLHLPPPPRPAAREKGEEEVGSGREREGEGGRGREEPADFYTCNTGLSGEQCRPLSSIPLVVFVSPLLNENRPIRIRLQLS